MRIGNLFLVFAVISVIALYGVCRAEDDLGVSLELPTTMVHPGELFYVKGYLHNPGPETYSNVPVCFVLEVYGEFWFWPSWPYFSPPEETGFDYGQFNVPIGSQEVDVLDEFTWPDTGESTAEGLRFYGAMLTQDMSQILGQFDCVEFDYGPWEDPFIASISPQSGPPGKMLRVKGNYFQLNNEDIQIIVGDEVLPVMAKGITEDGEREFVVTAIPFADPAYYAVKLRVNGLESNEKILEITELPPSGKPLGQVLQEVSEGFDGLCGHMNNDIIPNAAELGMIPAEAEADFQATVNRAGDIFHAFHNEWETLPDDEKEIIESILAQNGLDEIFDQMSERANRDFVCGEGEVALANLCLTLDVTSSALSIIDTAWNLVDLAALLGALPSGGTSVVGAVGIHFAIKTVDAVIDGVMPTDLQYVEFQGYGDSITVHENETLDLITVGTFDNQETPVAATLGMILDAILAALPASQEMKEEIIDFIIDILASLGLDIFEQLLGDDIMQWGDPQPLPLPIEFDQYENGFDWAELLDRTIFGPLGILISLMEELGNFMCDTGVKLDPHGIVSYSFDYEHMYLTGEQNGETDMTLVGMKMVPTEGWWTLLFDPDLPASVESEFDVTVDSEPTATPFMTSTPEWTETPTSPTPSPPPVPTNFIYYPPGTFQMGSPEDEMCRDGDELLHTVTLTQGFYIQQTETTQEQWVNVFGDNPSYFSGLQRPVEYITWYDACIYCNRLSTADGLTPCYYADESYSTVFDGTPPVYSGPVYWNQSANGYRLPTEAEWEYACRAGTDTAYNSGQDNTDCYDDPNLDPLAWYWYNSGDETHNVGQKQDNSWELFDMHGNVWEWCWDWYDGDYYEYSPVNDPTGPDEGSYRVLRGGGWYDLARYCRSAYRSSYSPDVSSYDFGFRPARFP